jgi:hypothetical protein
MVYLNFPVMKKAKHNRTVYILSFFLTFFHNFFVWCIVPTHCKCGGLLWHLVTLSDTHTHTHTHTHTVEHPWKRSRLYTETSAWQHSQGTDINAQGEIRTCNPSKRAANGLDPAVTGMDNSLCYHNCFTMFFFNSLSQYYHFAEKVLN